MARLHVSNVPDELDERLRSLARLKRRTLSAQVIALLADGVRREESRVRQAETLAQIGKRRFTPSPGTPDSVALLREDRSR